MLGDIGVSTRLSEREGVERRTNELTMDEEKRNQTTTTAHRTERPKERGKK